jgi:hypothetical protein
MRSQRTLAQAVGLSHSSVQRIWASVRARNRGAANTARPFHIPRLDHSGGRASPDGGRMSNSATAHSASARSLGGALHHRTLRSHCLSKCMSLFCSEGIANDDQFQE